MIASLSLLQREKISAVHERLVETYGRLTLAPGGDPLDELIGTILSQNTSDVNSGRAYARLRAFYPSWEEVLDTSDDELYEAIKPAGLGRIKAPRIKNTLREVLKRRGELKLDFLEQLPLEESKRWLTSLDGIGPKTAACVLLFALGQPALPVDTHVYRVSRRLGLIGERISAEAAHRLLEAEIPSGEMFNAHMLLIRHGRVICKALRPRCDSCPLEDV